MDIDDYSRDRERSPVRNRSRSPTRGSDRGGDRERSDRGYGRDRDSRGGYRGYDRGRRGRGGYSRGGHRGNHSGYGGYKRDYERKPYSNYQTTEQAQEEYRVKTDRNYDNSIFIGNIPYDVDRQAVSDIFKNDFNVVRADIVTNRGRSRGMATVEFDSKQAVMDAIQKFDHFEYRGREIFVRQDYPPPEDKRQKEFKPVERSAPEQSYNDGYSSRYDQNSRYGANGGRAFDKTSQGKQLPAPEPGTEVFVGNLPFSINWQALKDLMRECGEVLRANIREDDYGHSRGFGTVVFKTPEQATMALEKFQGYEIEGRQLTLRPGKTDTREHKKEFKNSEFTDGVEGDGERSDTIYTANLPFVTSVEDLYELFETIGKVVKAELQYNTRGKPSGNAVIQFEMEDLADLAIKNLNSYNYGGRDLAVSYAKRPGAASVVEETMEAEPEAVEEVVEEAVEEPMEETMEE